MTDDDLERVLDDKIEQWEKIKDRDIPNEIIGSEAAQNRVIIEQGMIEELQGLKDELVEGDASNTECGCEKCGRAYREGQESIIRGVKRMLDDLRMDQPDNRTIHHDGNGGMRH